MRIVKGIATGVASALLAITLFAAGFGVCCLPIVTQVLSRATSNAADAPYTSEQLTTLAQATRDFTVDDYGRMAFGDEGAQQALANVILQAAEAASAEGSPVADRWSAAARAALEGKASAASAGASAASAGASPSATAFDALAAVSDAYTFDADAVSHLQDCNKLIRSVAPWLWACAGASLAVLAALHIANRRNPRCARAAASICTAAPIALIVALAACGIWAAADFYGFFSAFHEVLFPQGNWTFSIDSLLICMYPLSFWMGMAAVWAATTLVACAASRALGAKLRKAS